MLVHHRGSDQCRGHPALVLRAEASGLYSGFACATDPETTKKGIDASFLVLVLVFVTFAQ